MAHPSSRHHIAPVRHHSAITEPVSHLWCLDGKTNLSRVAGLEEWRRISNRPRCRGAVWCGQPTSQARDARCLADSSAPIGLSHFIKHTFESWGGQGFESLELPWYWEASKLHWPQRPFCRLLLESLPAVYLRRSSTGAIAYNDMNTRSVCWSERQAQEVANPSKRRWG